jgi:hypothetical protein
MSELLLVLLAPAAIVGVVGLWFWAGQSRSPRVTGAFSLVKSGGLVALGVLGLVWSIAGPLLNVDTLATIVPALTAAVLVAIGLIGQLLPTPLREQIKKYEKWFRTILFGVAIIWAGVLAIEAVDEGKWMILVLFLLFGVLCAHGIARRVTSRKNGHSGPDGISNGKAIVE